MTTPAPEWLTRARVEEMLEDFEALKVNSQWSTLCRMALSAIEAREATESFQRVVKALCGNLDDTLADWLANDFIKCSMDEECQHCALLSDIEIVRGFSKALKGGRQ